LFILFVVVVASSGRCKTVTTAAAAAAARRILDREGGNDQRESWSVLVAITIFVFPQKQTQSALLLAGWEDQPHLRF
jgi:hypothetical protein